MLNYQYKNLDYIIFEMYGALLKNTVTNIKKLSIIVLEIL